MNIPSHFDQSNWVCPVPKMRKLGRGGVLFASPPPLTDLTIPLACSTLKAAYRSNPLAQKGRESVSSVSGFPIESKGSIFGSTHLDSMF